MSRMFICTLSWNCAEVHIIMVLKGKLKAYFRLISSLLKSRIILVYKAYNIISNRVETLLFFTSGTQNI